MSPLLSLSVESLQQKKIVDWGYTEELLAGSFKQFKKWIDKGEHGPLKYLSDERGDKREDLRLVYPEAQSALVFLFDYRAAKQYLQEVKPQYKLASYVIGYDDEDYHLWIKDRLEQIASKLGIYSFSLSLDIHPVLERDLAYRSGLGWFGKNSMILSREFGSYFLIGSLILPQKLELRTRELQPDHCGNCTRCIDACPTKAIIQGERTLIAEKCISTFTIETFKEEKPPTGYPTTTGEIFGCDICQEVCPWTRKTHTDEMIEESWLVDFFNRPSSEIINDIEQLSNKGFKVKFKGTSLERLGKKGLLKNLKA